MGELSDEDKLRMWVAIDKRSESEAQQLWGWVRELDRTARTLATHGKAAGPNTMTAFWIKLCGTLVEAGRYYDDMIGLMNPLSPTSSQNVKDVHAVRAVITAMRDALTEDQLIWLHYRRDVECHVWQTLYDLRAKDGKVQDHRKFELLGGKRLHARRHDASALHAGVIVARLCMG